MRMCGLGRDEVTIQARPFGLFPALGSRVRAYAMGLLARRLMIYLLLHIYPRSIVSLDVLLFAMVCRLSIEK